MTHHEQEPPIGHQQPPSDAEVKPIGAVTLELASITPETTGDRERLPIEDFKSEILSAITQNPVTIIRAETGAGKSTQVPQYLLEAGLRTVVTQPRRIAARNVARRVAEEHGTPLGQDIGYRVSGEGQDSEDTSILFCTDGLAIVRELMGRPNRDVLVIDELHEWNTNIEVLVAWAKRQQSEGDDFKLVLMSATMEAAELSKYFDDAPIIEVPGRLFPITEQERGERPESDAIRLASDDHNVLVFQPGMAEINSTVEYINRTAGDVFDVFALHGSMPADEQQKVFQPSKRPKIIVATNVAQTSITIPDITAVVDSGTERRIETNHGVEGLFLRPISIADRIQRMGRAGRTAPGIYIDHCPEIIKFRPNDPVPEIMRDRLDQLVLRLAIAGINAEDLEFFHQPDRSEIHRAREQLTLLGLLSESGLVTEIGQKVARLPVSVEYGRMIVEAETHGVVDDIVIIAAILEEGGIVVRNSDWNELSGGETSSDLVAQLNVFNNARGLTKQQMMDKGIRAKSYSRVKDQVNLINKALSGKVTSNSEHGNPKAITLSIVSGLIGNLYLPHYRRLLDRHGQLRQLSDDSVINVHALDGRFVVGVPFDIETRRGVLPLVNLATEVDLATLLRAAPHLAEIKTGISPRYDAVSDTVVSTTRISMLGMQLHELDEADPDNPQTHELLVSGRSGRQWEAWARPEIPRPDDANLQDYKPEINVFIYGQNADDGTPLSAYAVVTVDHLRKYDPSSRLKSTVQWFRSKEEADRALDQTAAVISENKARQEDADLLIRLRDQIQATQAKIYDFTETTIGLMTGDRQHLLNLAGRHLSSGLAARVWIEEARNYLGEAESRAVENRKKQEAAARREIELERELAPIFDALRSDGYEEEDMPVEVVDKIRQFAEAVSDPRLLRGQLEAPHGRFKRQQAIKQGLHPTDYENEGVRKFLESLNAQEVIKWLTGALAWLERNNESDEGDEGDAVDIESADEVTQAMLEALRKRFAR